MSTITIETSWLQDSIINYFETIIRDIKKPETPHGYTFDFEYSVDFGYISFGWNYRDDYYNQYHSNSGSICIEVREALAYFVTSSFNDKELERLSHV